MADRAVAMLRDSLKAFIDRDVETARQICDADDEVDRLQDSVYDECIKRHDRRPRDGAAQHLPASGAAHNLERIADRCTNICERVIFIVTGQMEEINVSKY